MTIISRALLHKNAQEGEENMEENQENKEDRDMDEQEVRMSIELSYVELLLNRDNLRNSYVLSTIKTRPKRTTWMRTKKNMKMIGRESKTRSKVKKIRRESKMNLSRREMNRKKVRHV
jgi:hypothetical protein